MKYFIYSIILFGYFLMPAVLSIMGYNEEYDPDADDPMLIKFRVLSFIVALFFLCKKNLSKNNLYYVYCLAIPFIFTIDFVFEYYFLPGNFHERAIKTYLIFIIYSMPGVWIGVDLANDKNAIKEIYKYLHLYCLFISIVSALVIPRFLSEGKFIMGNINYQEFSYSSAVCFCVILYYLMFKPVFVFELFKNTTVKYLSVILLPILAMCIFLSGGRGGAVLMIISIIVLYILKSRDKKKNLFAIFVKISLLFIFISALIQLSMSYFPVMEDLYNFERIFSYINSSGEFDASESSGRDEIAQAAFSMFLESPLWGYGTFRAPGLFGMPHNIFLEILLDGGMLLFCFYLFVFIYAYNKFRCILNVDHDNYCLIPIALYPVVLLQFSGVYLFTQLFWFIMAYILAFRKDRIKYTI